MPTGLEFIALLFTNPTLWIALLAPFIIGRALESARWKISHKILDNGDEPTHRGYVLERIRSHLEKSSWAMTLADIVMQIFAFLVPLIYLPVYFFLNYKQEVLAMGGLDYYNWLLLVICLGFTILDIILFFGWVWPSRFLGVEEMIEYKKNLENGNMVPPMNVPITWCRLYVLINALFVFLLDAYYLT